MIEFFFDCSSPWTYLAFHNIQPLAKEFGVEITWRPILVGGIFNAINPSVYASREKPVPAKAAYTKKDLADWARSAGLAIKMPPPLPEITLRALALVPPMVFTEQFGPIKIPSQFEAALVPEPSVPIKLPAMTLLPFSSRRMPTLPNPAIIKPRTELAPPKIRKPVA